jgi:DNA-binding XRE family transcriptional regulator
MTRGSQSPGDDLTGRELAPPLRGGGFQLPGLKHWRLRRGLSQVELARRADLSTDYLWNVESGRRGCNPSVAQHLADLLKVDLPDLRTNPLHPAPQARVLPEGRGGPVGHV